MGEFNSMLRQWYEAEVAGAAFFGAMARGAKVEAEAAKWTLLGRLEATMAEQLGKTCAAESIDVPAESPRASELLAYAQSLEGKSWQAIMEDMMPQLKDAVVEVQNETSQAPPDHAELAARFMAHEEALAAFVTAEVEGDDGSPAIDSLLCEWA